MITERSVGDGRTFVEFKSARLAITPDKISEKRKELVRDLTNFVCSLKGEDAVVRDSWMRGIKFHG